jgi:hypothetical protein
VCPGVIVQFVDVAVVALAMVRYVPPSTLRWTA